jgi:amino acid adenylation domain-containing protein
VTRAPLDLSEAKCSLLDAALASRGLAPDGPIPRRAQSRAAPLSFAQRRLWFLDQLYSGSAAYVIPASLRVGAVDLGALQAALDELAARHEVLRTTFPLVGDEPVQVIGADARLPLRVEDLTCTAVTEREGCVAAAMRKEATRSFDLTAGPLARVRLLRLSGTEGLLLFTIHHIVADAWSVGVIFRELTELYAAFTTGRAPQLPVLPIAYADFAAWQRDRLTGARLRAELEHWTTELSQLPPLELPTDRPRDAGPRGSAGLYPVVLGRAETEGLRALARRGGTTLFMAVVAAFAALLGRLSGQHDFGLGIPIANRDRPELEGLVGFFVNTLVMRCRLDDNPTFLAVLDRIRATALAAYSHAELPFELLVETLAPERSVGRNPLVDVVVQLFGLEGAVEAPPMPPAAEAKFDLYLVLWETPDEVRGHLEYSVDLFDEATVARLVMRFQALVTAVGRAPDSRPAELDLLLPGERELLLDGWGHTEAPYPRDATIHELFRERATAAPERPALVCEDDVVVSYGELERRANALAHDLRDAGVGPETPVGIFLGRSPELIIAVLAVLKAGGAYVPLDPAYPPERVRVMLEDAACPVIVTDGTLARRLPGGKARVLCVGPDRRDDPPRNPHAGARSLAYVMYTSGSTGRPKGVCVEHRGVVRLVRGANYARWDADDVFMQLAPTSFDAATFEIWGALLTGARLALPPPGPLSLEELGDCLQRHQVTVLWLTAGLFDQMVECNLGGLRGVRELLAGGDVLSPVRVRRAVESLPGCRVINGYGPTENTTFSCCHAVERADDAIAPLPIGRPIANTRAYVLDERLAPAPIGVPGELCVAGDGLARGYHNAPELTARRFIEDPHGPPGTRLYRTGDRARWRGDGTLEFLGRLDDQLKIRGHRIEPAEITTVLQTHPDVADAAVIAREQAPGDRRLTAYIVPRPTASEGEAQAGVEAWQHLYDETYGGPSDADPTFDLTGWTSALDGRPIPAEEMREWLETTVARILAAEPRRVLEIGCGTGLILHAIAPRVEEYAGTDLSPVVIERLGKAVARRGLSGVRLAACPADELPNLGGPFDMLVINSVVQYFPSIEYLLGVLERALEQLAPRAIVFVGDVRSLPLLRALHLEIERAQDPGKAPVAAGVAARVARERELVLDPAFFLALTHGLSRIVHAETAPKLGRAPNELNRFRYDAVLRLDAVPEPASPPWSDWPRGEAPTVIVARLCDAHPGGFAVREIPDARVADALDALAAIDGADPRGGNAQDPWTLCELGAKRGYGVTTRLSPTAPGSFDAIFVPTGRQTRDVVARMPGAALRPWASYANAPLQARAAESLVPELRRLLRAQLPDGIVPAHIVALERLPRTANGKLDRQALPAPATASQHRQSAPRTSTEKAIASLWTELLGIDGIDVNDNFFTELGGHSLLATQVTARLRAEHRIDLPLRRLFEHPTIAGLAADVDGAIAAGEDATAAPIPRQPRAAVEEAR